MIISRRTLLSSVTSVGAAALISEPGNAQAAVAGGMLNSRTFGVEPNASHDQSELLQKAIDAAVQQGGYLFVEPGRYFVSGLQIAAGLNLVGVPGQTRLVQADAKPVISVEGTTGVRIDGVVLDGQLRNFDTHGALLVARSVRDLRVSNCLITNSAANGMRLNNCSGAITSNIFETCVAAGIYSNGARELRIEGNWVSGMGDNGILIWQPSKRSDGTIVTGNRIEKISARSGGSGQNGNAINVFRADNVVITQNQISNCAFTAIRNHSGDNIQISTNHCHRLGEVAIYCEFAFAGGVVSNNVVDNSGLGISITNFNDGGRLATVTGNLVRNLITREEPIPTRAIGISVEADTVVANNVVENAPMAGLWLGWGKYLRNVSATGNLIRDCGFGIAASLAVGAQGALIANNLISGARDGAIVGMDHNNKITEDLSVGGRAIPNNLAIHGNVSN
jgi:uncharacterized secreted repeat protein (TIGR03808 family)